MPQLDQVEWGILTTLGFFAAMTIWTIWWPRVHYESSNPYLRGEDFWNPLRKQKGRRFSRGPRLFKRPSLTERGLEEAVAARLRFASSLEWRDILARVHGTTATLFRHVPSEHERELAQILARSVEGITHVKNELSVQSVPEWIRDAS